MKDLFIGKTCVIRSNGAGVFMGEIVSQDGDSAVAKNCRRLWRWDGACSIDEIAMRGVANPGQCKFPVVVGEKLINNVLEIIPATDKSIESIYSVQEWTQFKE